MARTRDPQAQRALLSEAVWATLADLGPGGLTLRAVAERAGCTTGLVMHTFGDKRALLLHARDRLHERTGARTDRLEREAASPEEALRAVALGTLAADPEGLANARVWVGFLAASLSDPDLAAKHALHSGSFRTRLTRLIRAAVTVTEAEATARAALLAATTEGVCVLAAGDPAAWSAELQHAAVNRALEAALTDA
ncbi:TetR family transcriptional regulator [Mycetocola tolaasinivorans]|uniref:TetR family transcriptional regulator n=1 Tax=Mycetocola tolaasinivorans TaxID=76635 RepID=A0A3L7A680_9MICO|nr:TetR family transcriptional regulator C-terminal domain-containing protein [Mycetocola tolaasinivorans]RLP75565.1 TetR family transcriptional regulator [Mycetocola tolaasinivorans]